MGDSALEAPGTFARLDKDEALGRIYAIAPGGVYAFDATT